MESVVSNMFSSTERDCINNIMSRKQSNKWDTRKENVQQTIQRDD